MSGVNVSWILTQANRAPVVPQQLLICSLDSSKWPYSTRNASPSCQGIALRASSEFWKIANSENPRRCASDRGKLVEASACPTKEGLVEISGHPALSGWTLRACLVARGEQTDVARRRLPCIHTSPLNPSNLMQRTGRSLETRETGGSDGLCSSRECQNTIPKKLAFGSLFITKYGRYFIHDV